MTDKKDYWYFDIVTGETFANAEQALEAQKALKEQAKREESKKKNPPFIQLTKGVSPDVLAKIASESSTAIQVLMFFFKNMDDYNVIMVSQNVIAEAIDKTKRAVTNAIKVLEKNGAIGIAKVSNANVYIVNPEIAWQKAYKQRGIAKMKAIVLLGQDENEKLFNRFHEVHKISETNSLKMDNVSTKIIKGKKEKPQEMQEIEPSEEH